MREIFAIALSAGISVLNVVIPARPLATTWESPCGRSPLAGPGFEDARILALHGCAMTGGIQESFNQARKLRCAPGRGILFQLMLDWVPACDASGIVARRRRDDDGRRERRYSALRFFVLLFRAMRAAKTLSAPRILCADPAAGIRASISWQRTIGAIGSGVVVPQ